ncbi:zf-TFIIB domain-containing protein [Shewanella sp. FJAT-52076]|uniref:TFIIB-type zinc ribbon-containing protein n=1 Tax=Shewanella sp. FJAT-52076 TaxID=2864202 RepID=UPI0021AC68C3|nr:zf-TFIIB domain-containing protein [Shewanella sp. FJAT-52076]
MMHCSACKHGSLVPTRLDNLFLAHRCNHCGGHWVLIDDFVTWKQANPDTEFEAITAVEDSEDSPMALFCPMSHTLMRKLKISTDTDHRLDYSAAVGGVWLDKGEWPLLKSMGLASCLNLLVTQEWQNRLKQSQTQANFGEHYRRKFGDSTYTELKRIRDWLQGQPNKAELKSYLLADDPYSTKR